MANEKIIAIAFIGILLIALAIADLDTSDIDALPECNITNSIIYRNNTNWKCITYATYNNITLTSPNGTQYNCGVNNTGTITCS